MTWWVPFALVVMVVAALVGAWSVLASGTAPARTSGSVVWDPTDDVVAGLPGPLVYLVRLGAPVGDPGRDLVKIGVATSSRPGAGPARVRQWSTGSPHPLVWVAVITTPSAVWLERELHRVFSGARVHGGRGSREWFRLPEDRDGEWRPVVEDLAGG